MLDSLEKLTKDEHKKYITLVNKRDETQKEVLSKNYSSICYVVGSIFGGSVMMRISPALGAALMFGGSGYFVYKIASREKKYKTAASELEQFENSMKIKYENE